MAKYVRPLPPDATTKRSDQGQDYAGKPGQHVVAIGRAHVDAIKRDPGGFGIAIYYTLLDGPSKGQQIYVGHAQPNVRVGQTVRAGQAVATLLASSLGNANGLAGWAEVGLAKNGAPQYSAPDGGPALQRLLKGAAPDANAAAAPATTPPAADGSTDAAPQYPGVVGISQPTPVAPPAPAETALPEPGSQNFALPNLDAAPSWQMLSELPNLSADTQRYLALIGG